MPLYLVEVYVPRSAGHAVQVTGDRARAAAEELSRESVAIAYLRTTYLPEDETCFHLFEADSPEAVVEASRRAGLEPARVVSAIDASISREPG